MMVRYSPEQPSSLAVTTVIGLVPANPMTLTCVNQSQMNESHMMLLYVCPILGIAGVVDCCHKIHQKDLSSVLTKRHDLSAP